MKTRTSFSAIPIATLLCISLFFAFSRVRVRGAGTLPAFPGAQGGGASSVGGRGGTVFKVTNLNNSGAGSLRACVEATGPRTCVFRVAGLITSLSRLAVTHPFITIAGQTAPGGGIVLGGVDQIGEQLDIQTHDVIVRYLTYDGTSPRTPGPSTGTIGFEMANGGGDVYNVVFDHLSTRWAGNKDTIIYANDSTGAQHVKNTSTQWVLEYEPNYLHPVGPTYTAIRDPHEDSNNDRHHSVFINIDHRIPLSELDNWRWVSNLTYNWSYFASNQSGSHSDFIGNKWVFGPQSAGISNPHPVNATLGNGSGSGNCLSNCDLAGTPSIYMLGNVGPQGTDYQLSAEEAGNDPEGFPEVVSPIRAGWRRSTPLPAEQFPITPDSANILDSVLLPSVGNSQMVDCNGNFVSRRDSEDARVIAQYQALGPGGGFGGPDYTGPGAGPSIAAGTPCTESLDDGIPDQWKTAQGLSTTDANLHNALAPDGYTYLEKYMNAGATAPPVLNPPPPTPPPSGAPGAGSANLLDVSREVKGLLAAFNMALPTVRRTCMIVVGVDNAAAVLVDADLGPQGRQCEFPYDATVVEVTVAADAGTPNVLVAKNHAGTLANLTSSALATAGSGGLACSNAAGTLAFNGATTCSSTLQNTAIAAGDWIDLRSGTAGGVAKRVSVAVIVKVN